VTPPPVVAAPGAPVNATDRFAWPPPTANSFGLKVSLDAPGKRDKDGKILLHDGSSLSIRLTAEKDCRVTVWLLEAGGRETKLFPNEKERDDRLFAGQERVIPGNDTYELRATPTEGEGADRIRVVATTGEPLPYPPGTKNGDFTFYANEAERERLASTMRGIAMVNKTNTVRSPGLLSERELQFRVSK
jgi:hypothetical protein